MNEFMPQEIHEETQFHDEMDNARQSYTYQQSSSVGELFASLADAQNSIRNAEKNESNPFFKSKYADLTAVWNVCREPLSAQGLSVVQMPHFDGDTVYVTTILGHSSGQWISSVLGLKPTKLDPQGIGSAVTYGRRYALASFVGVAPAGEDDDGNASSQVAAAAPAAHTAPPAKKKKRGRPTTADELNRMLVSIGVKTTEEADVVCWYVTDGGVETVRDARDTPANGKTVIAGINDRIPDDILADAQDYWTAKSADAAEEAVEMQEVEQ